MSITPLSPNASAKGKIKHGSLLNENLCLSRVNSQWKSTGTPQKEIAAQMGISLSAVEKHLQKAYRAVLDVQYAPGADWEEPDRHIVIGVDDVEQ